MTDTIASKRRHALTRLGKSGRKRVSAPRDGSASGSAPLDDSTLAFEPLEPRLLLSVDPLSITAGYSFDEIGGTSAADSSGHNITGTLTSGPTFSAGHSGNALTLDGVNDYVTLGNPASLQFSGSISISAWINSSSFPVDDAAIVSKRGSGDNGFQLDTTIDTGRRTIGFKLTNSSGVNVARYGNTTLQANTWYYVTGVYDAAAQTMHVYLNGQLDDGVLQGTVTTTQQNAANNVTIGRRSGLTGFEFAGRIDDVRIADHAISLAQIQSDMVTPLTLGPDTIAPSTPAGLTATPVSTTQINLAWTASTDNVGVVGYQVFRNGAQIATTTTNSFSNTGLTPSTLYQYSVKAYDLIGNVSASSATVNATTPGVDGTAPSVNLTGPTANATVAGTITLTATASDNVAVSGVQFLLDGNNLGAEDTASPYSLSWNTTTATSGTHTIAARARDAAGNATTASITVIVDNQAPTGTVAINGGAAATNSRNVTLALTASDALSGVTQMRFSNTGVANSFSTAEAFAATKAWTLATGSGTKTVYVQFKDAAGNWSASATATILLDTAAPTISARTATSITSTSAVITWTTNEAASSQVDFGPTTAYGTSTTINPALLTAHSVSLTGLAPNTTYNYRVRSRDAAGNETVSANSTFKTAATTDAVAPTVAITAPTGSGPFSGTIAVSANASDNVGVVGVQFLLDGQALGAEDTTSPYTINWDTTAATNGNHSITARARDAAGNTAVSAPLAVTVSNGNFFRNEILATGFDLPIAMQFLPDGRLLVAEFAGTIKIVQPPYTQVDATPFLQLTNIAPIGSEVDYGIMDFKLDPNFATNHYFYVFYTALTPNRDRMSRFTANDALTGTIAGSELVLYQDPLGDVATNDHHGGAINIDNDGKIYVTTGDHYNNPGDSQLLTSPRGKILRINPDGTVPTDNPFYDGAGPNFDAIWALGLRNPYRAYYDAATDRLLIGDVGGNDYSTAIEELNIGARGANYGWPNIEAPNGNPAYTAPAYYYPHNGRDACITGGFVYHGTQFPSSYQGSYFFGDYTQNWIKRVTFDANGNVNGTFNFEPANGAADGPYGDIIYLTEGPEGALYYLDLGFSELSGTYSVAKIRRISYIQSDQPPAAVAAATPTQGQTPLSFDFSSAGSSDPEGKPLTFLWNFGDNTTSTLANPTHVYSAPGLYQARLTVSDGVNSTVSAPLSVAAGNAPTVAILSPTVNAPLFRAGDIISFSGSASDIEDGILPTSAYTWNIDFLHEGHVHPGTPAIGVTSGTFAIPASGHDFSGLTRYRITLTVTDSNGLKSSQSVIVFPDKVNLTFDTIPTGATIYLDGIAHTAPFVYDTLIGFTHTINAPDQSVGTSQYTFASWSDGGAQQHTLVVPPTAQSYFATYNVSVAIPPLAFLQVNAATPQTNQTQVSSTYTSAQTAGNTNILAIGWNNATSTISSVVDSAGNVYQLAVPIARGTGISQAIYYAKNIKAAAAGANTVTVTFNTTTAFVDLRITEYSGLDFTSPFEVGASASGSSSSASSGAITTTAANELIFGAGITTGGFSAAGSGFTNRLITVPDADIVEDRFTTATGSYSATASLGGSAAWVMQVAAFKTASPAGAQLVAQAGLQAAPDIAPAPSIGGTPAGAGAQALQNSQLSQLGLSILVPSSLAAQPGQLFQVPVNAENCAGFASLALKIAYDPTALEPSGVHVGPLSAHEGDWSAVHKDGLLELKANYRKALRGGKGSLYVLEFRAKSQLDVPPELSLQSASIGRVLSPLNDTDPPEPAKYPLVRG